MSERVCKEIVAKQKKSLHNYTSLVPVFCTPTVLTHHRPQMLLHDTVAEVCAGDVRRLIANHGTNYLSPNCFCFIKEGCDLFSGNWVKDELTQPLYQEPNCPYIKPQVKCQVNDRPDNEYLYWRSQPHGCSIPRFNATYMLETLRGKKMMFVGDSLIRGQFVSMVCLLHSIIPNNSKSMDYGNILKAKDYNVTIEFYRAPFLLESNSDNPAAHRISESDRMVSIGSINKHGQCWQGAIMVKQ